MVGSANVKKNIIRTRTFSKQIVLSTGYYCVLTATGHSSPIQRTEQCSHRIDHQWDTVPPSTAKEERGEGGGQLPWHPWYHKQATPSFHQRRFASIRYHVLSCSTIVLNYPPGDGAFSPQNRSPPMPKILHSSTANGMERLSTC